MNLTTERRVQIGNAARFALQCGCEELVGEELIQFWNAVLDEARRHLPQKEESNNEMSYARAKEFEQQIMPFGKFAGTRIADLETEYITRVVDPSPFVEELKRYVRWRIDNGS